ncbi:MAG: transporter substrate-binding domain-containing protein [Psychrosphaera sp.]|nr:transporter substrate-binding domain-containing protein [Psychrosphaera sp.]
MNFIWNAYCPFTCEKDKTGQTGYAMELVRAVFDNSKYQIEYTYALSWNRAMSQVENGEKDAIVFSFHGPESDHLYVIPKQSLAWENQTSFAVKKTSKWQFRDANSLKTLQYIGVYKGTVWIDKAIAKFEQDNTSKFVYLHGDDIVKRAFDMLRRGRLDAWEDSQTLLNYHIYSHGIEDLRIETLIKPYSSTGDLLFSGKNPKSKEYAAFFSAGIKQLRKSGKLKIILEKYGLKDWQ